MEEKEKQMEKRCCFSRGHSLEQVPAASEGRGGLGSQFSILYKGGRNLQKGLPNQKAALSPDSRTCAHRYSASQAHLQKRGPHPATALERGPWRAMFTPYSWSVQAGGADGIFQSSLLLCDLSPSSPNLLSVAWS